MSYKYCIIAPIVGVYLAVSILLLEKVHITSKVVVDELFHLPQGLIYCQHNFSVWDPKITTLPGLYIWSTLFCGLIGTCTVHCLRFTSILASVLNFLLLIKIIGKIEVTEPSWKVIFNALNLTLFPPLFFFSQLYYTDVISVTSILLFYALRDLPLWTTICGFLSFCVRQTNIVYFGVMEINKLIGLIFNRAFYKRRSTRAQKITDNDIDSALKWKLQLRPLQQIFNSPKLFLEIALNLLLFLSVVYFIITNKGIVVGDKSAHKPTLHLMQFLYFTLFALFFAWPFMLTRIQPFLGHLKNNIFICLFIVVTLLIIVHFNTLEHPYLLADNRHYIFYVWKRFFNIPLKRYLWTPVYTFGIYAIFTRIYNRLDVRFALTFFPTVALAVCLQSLLEIRYFIIPYLLMRLHFSVNTKELVAEFIFYVAINLATFYVFFTKEIYWDDFEDVQRLLW